MPLNYDDPKYLCCCGCHVTKGIKIICGINLVICILNAFSNFPIGLVWAAIIGSCLYMPFLAIKKIEPKYMYPYFVAVVFDILFFFGSFLYLILSKPNSGGSADTEKAFNILLISMGIAGVLKLGFGIWFLTIAFRCFQFLQEQKMEHTRNVPLNV